MTDRGWTLAPIDVAVPAHRDFVAAIRAVARSSAALADLAVDDVEELQLAVDEAATLLLPLVEPGEDGRLAARFEVAERRVGVRLSAACRPGAEVDTAGLPWIMLLGLDPEVEVTREDHDDPARTVLAIAVARTRSDAEA